MTVSIRLLLQSGRVLLLRVPNEPQRIRTVPEVSSGVRHHGRLIAGPLPPHGLLGLLVEQLVWVEFWTVAGPEAELRFRPPLRLAVIDGLRSRPCGRDASRR